MTVVFDSRKIPGIQLRYTAQLATHGRGDIGASISKATHDVVTRLANEIVRGRGFVRVEQVGTGPYLNITADCIVMSHDELRELMQSQFRAGIDHAHGMMTPIHHG